MPTMISLIDLENITPLLLLLKPLLIHIWTVVKLKEKKSLLWSNREWNREAVIGSRLLYFSAF